MTVKVGINGFGRIGRMVFRAAVVGIDRYGESAPAPALFRHFHFTVDNLVDTVRQVLSPTTSKE